MELKDYLAESLNSEHGYRIKIAGDCGSEEMDKLEKCLQKYDVVSVAGWKRTPIEENPAEFVRLKGLAIVSEVCSTDVVLRYAQNERILEVWLAVNMGIDPSKVIVYGVKEPRLAAAEMAAAQVVKNKDRSVTEEDSLLSDDSEADMSHYGYQDDKLAEELVMFGEEYNEKFQAELLRIRKEKGDDYFRNYPTKDEIRGDNLRPVWDALNNGANMGKGETGKEVDIINQHGSGKV